MSAQLTLAAAVLAAPALLAGLLAAIFFCCPSSFICFRRFILKSEMSPVYRLMVWWSQIQISLAT